MKPMTLEEWRRELLRLMQLEQAARAEVNRRPDPLAAEHAYARLRDARNALQQHYAIRPEYV
jgi:hypothetical protein